MSQTVRAALRGILGLSALTLGTTLAAAPASAAGSYVLTPVVENQVSIEAGHDSGPSFLRMDRTEKFDAKVAVTVTVDLAAFGGKVRLTGSGCTAAGTVYTCTYTRDVTADDGLQIGLTDIIFSAAADTTPASKTVTWKMSTDQSAPAEVSQTLAVTGAGKLYSDAYREIDGTAGGTVSVPMSVRNGGGTDVHNPSLWLQLSVVVTPTSLPSNCVRHPNGYRVDVECSFVGTTLKAGSSYKLSRALELAIAADTPGDFEMSYAWEHRLTEGGEQGTGPALTLTDTSEAPTGQGSYNRVLIKIPYQSAPDLALTATGITGQTGATVDLTFTITNLSKHVVGMKGRYNRTPVAYTLPKGVSAVTPCNAIVYALDPELKGMCKVDTGVEYLRAGEKTSVTVKVRLDKAVAGATGSASMFLYDEEENAPILWTDVHNANNKITLTAAITHPGPLAKTGVSMPVLTGMAGLFVVAGGSAVAVTRRRK